MGSVTFSAIDKSVLIFITRHPFAYFQTGVFLCPLFSYCKLNCNDDLVIGKLMNLRVHCLPYLLVSFYSGESFPLQAGFCRHCFCSAFISSSLYAVWDCRYITLGRTMAGYIGGQENQRNR